MNRPPCSAVVPLREHALREVRRVTDRFDFEKMKKMPREVIEEIMVLCFIRGASYERETRERESREHNRG